MQPHHGQNFLLLTLLAAFVSKVSAGPFDADRLPPPSVRQDQVASIHVVVTSARPWEEYVDALQPKFELSAPAALARVSEVNRLQDNRTFDGLGFSFRAEVGATLGGSNAEAISLPNTAVTSGRAAAVESALKFLTNPIPVTSSLQYLAATALFQEVQLINRAFRDAVEFESFTPYVVRLQVTVMPRKRDAPFDVLSDLSFQIGEPKLELECVPKGDVVRVVPMLVTDSIESAVHSESAERLRSLSLALAAVLPKASLAGSLDRLKDTIDSIVGRDYNAVFTVARLTDNTVRCRIGALAQVSTGFSLVPQNHSLTLLVFVPDSLATNKVASARRLRLISNNSLVSIKTGESLKQLSNNDFIYRIKRFLTANQIDFRGKYRDNSSNQVSGLAKMFSAVARNNFSEFIDLHRECLQQQGTKDLKGVLFPDALWSEFTAIWATSQFAVAQFDLPKRPDDNSERVKKWRETVGERLLAVDDGETLTITCPGFPRLSNEVVMGKLSASADTWLDKLAAGPAVYDEAAATLTLQFPSLTVFPHKLSDDTMLSLELSPQPKQRSTLSTANRAINWSTSSNPPDKDKKSGAIPLTYLPIKKAKVDPKPGFKLFASTGTIVMDKLGKGSATFAVQDIEPKATINLKGTLEGAALTGILPANVKAKQDGLLWKADGVDAAMVVTFGLEGLNPAVEVNIGAINTTNKASSNILKFKVILPDATK